jgi:hypothetical protein
MDIALKILFLPYTILCLLIIAIFQFVVWNEPNRAWEIRANRREGPNCRPFIDETIFLQRRIRELTDSNRNLREELEKERRKRK